MVKSKNTFKKFCKTGNFLLSLVVAIMFLFPGCQKAPINGDLDGMWEVMDVYPEPQEIIHERLYYRFYLHVCMLSYYGYVYTSGNLKYDDGYIMIDFPYSQSELAMKELKQYGINSNPVKFEIDYLDKNKLIMRDGETVVTLRKF